MTTLEKVVWLDPFITLNIDSITVLGMKKLYNNNPFGIFYCQVYLSFNERW